VLERLAVAAQSAPFHLSCLMCPNLADPNYVRDDCVMARRASSESGAWVFLNTYPYFRLLEKASGRKLGGVRGVARRWSPKHTLNQR
jgi:hypothetical protein